MHRIGKQIHKEAFFYTDLTPFLLALLIADIELEGIASPLQD